MEMLVAGLVPGRVAELVVVAEEPVQGGPSRFRSRFVLLLLRTVRREAGLYF